MSAGTAGARPSGPAAPVAVGSRDAKLISCILPDDGGERRLLRWLKDEQGILRANSVYCRGHAALNDAVARRGRLTEPVLARLVTVVVEAGQADALFDRIYREAGIGRPGGGTLIMAPLTFATAFLLPDAVPDEQDSDES